MLLVFQCCQHTCICETEVSRSNGDHSEGECDDDLLVEVEEEEDESEMTIFQPTHEWQIVREGEVLPAGLHVRMNLETGLREARLMSEEKAVGSSAGGTQSKEEETLTGKDASRTQDGRSGRERASDEDTVSTHPGSHQFKGDQRRSHYYGHSDRRGIINKRRRAFSQREVAEMMKNRERESDAADSSRPPEISFAHREAEERYEDTHVHNHFTEDESQNVNRAEQLIQQSLHPDLSQMMEHSRTLARQAATTAELLHALEELEYHVHHIDNARDLNSIGGLVLVVRLLNHSHPDIRSSAAHVLGSASQRSVGGDLTSLPAMF